MRTFSIGPMSILLALAAVCSAGDVGVVRLKGRARPAGHSSPCVTGGCTDGACSSGACSLHGCRSGSCPLGGCRSGGCPLGGCRLGSGGGHLSRLFGRGSRNQCENCEKGKNGSNNGECEECDDDRCCLAKYCCCCNTPNTSCMGLWVTMANPLAGNTYSPDHGWSPPVKHMIDRVPVQYRRYWPRQWYGLPGGGISPSAPQFPMVYMPTDTTQTGFYYQRVPAWTPNPSMIPSSPWPSAYHNRMPLPPRPKTWCQTCCGCMLAHCCLRHCCLCKKKDDCECEGVCPQCENMVFEGRLKECQPQTQESQNPAPKADNNVPPSPKSNDTTAQAPKAPSLK